MPHPAGEIAVSVRRDGERLTGEVTLPAGVTGTLRVNGEQRPIVTGRAAF